MNYLKKIDIQSIQEYKKLIDRYKIKSIEDPFAENDWISWSKLMKSIKNVQIVGDDLYVTNLERLKKGCLLYTSPSPRDRTRSRMPSSA